MFGPKIHSVEYIRVLYWHGETWEKVKLTDKRLSTVDDTEALAKAPPDTLFFTISEVKERWVVVGGERFSHDKHRNLGINFMRGALRECSEDEISRYGGRDKVVELPGGECWPFDDKCDVFLPNVVRDNIQSALAAAEAC